MYDGRLFPDWEGDAGKQSFQIVVQRQPFVQILQKAMTESVMMKIGDGTVSLRVPHGPTIGAVQSEVPIEYELEIGLSPKFLLDFAASAEGDLLLLAYGDSPRLPIRLYSEADNFIYFLMPMLLTK